PAITTQPSNQTVTAGANATFTVAASGAPAPTYQWQVSTNGGSTFTNVSNAAPYSGATTATLTITGTSASLTGNQYRAVATNSVGTATSAAATLTVSGPVAASPAALRFSATRPGATSALTAVTAGQAVTVTFTGAASAWTATANQPWVQITNG